MPVLLSETIAYTPLELSYVISAVHQPSHKSRDPTSREAIGVGQSSVGSGKQWAKFSQFCTELCHLNPKPTLCISKVLQNLMKAHLFISVPNSCLHWRGKKNQRDQMGNECLVTSYRNYSISQFKPNPRLPSHMNKCPGESLATNAQTAKPWTLLYLAGLEQVVFKNMNRKN